MAIYINGVTIVADAVVEPVSLTDAKNWMRIDYTSDDSLIQSLLNASRVHLEKLTGLSFVNKLIRTNFELTGTQPPLWMVDLPYGPLVCMDELKIKTGIGLYDILSKKMNADRDSLLSQYPNWDGLNYHQYKKVNI